MNRNLLATTIIVGGLITQSCTKEDMPVPNTKGNIPPPAVVATPATGQKQKTDTNYTNYQDNYDKLLGILDPTGRMLKENISQIPNQNKMAQSKTNQSKKNIIEKIISLFKNK